MSNVTELHIKSDTRRSNRADFVRQALTHERWSMRKAAMALGMNHTVLSSRTRGDTAFLAEEIEAIAELLHRDPVQFYADYLNSGNRAPAGPPGLGHTAKLDASKNAEPRTKDYGSRDTVVRVDFTRRVVTA